MEETASFLNSLLSIHGFNYLERLFGPRARHSLRMMGGVDTVAIALSGGKEELLLYPANMLRYVET